MKLVIRVLLICLFASTATAEEGTGAYFAAQPFGQEFSGEVTAVEQTGGLGRTNTFGGSVGFALNDYFMFDVISVNYAERNYSDANPDNSVSTVNIITELRAGLFGGDFPLKPYAAVGVGASRVTFDFQDGLVSDYSSWGLAWEVGGGIDYPVSDYNISLGIFYRYRSSVSLANNWHPTGAAPQLTPNENAAIYSDWKVSYHAIGIELRFGGVRGL
jgi:hypothetical protein